MKKEETKGVEKQGERSTAERDNYLEELRAMAESSFADTKDSNNDVKRWDGKIGLVVEKKLDEMAGYDPENARKKREEYRKLFKDFRNRGNSPMSKADEARMKAIEKLLGIDREKLWSEAQEFKRAA